MAGVGTVAITVGLGVAINGAYDLQTGSDNTSVTVLAGGAVLGILIIIGSVSNEWELVEAMAVLFLVGSFFLHGTKIAGISTALNSKSTKKDN